MSRRRNKKYSAGLKLQAVQDYLNGKGSLWDICHKYKIVNEKSLREWIMWYNGHKEFAVSMPQEKIQLH